MALATFEETALGAFLHDIGKFMQRARALAGGLPAEARRFTSDVLPGEGGRYTHRHALWTWAFFDELEQRRLSLPGARLAAVRELAAYHHQPLQQNPLTSLIQRADQLASGMERKPRDEAAEQQGESDWSAFIRVPLESIFSHLRIGLGEPRPAFVPLARLAPGEGIIPRETVDREAYPDRYLELWNAFFVEFEQACHLPTFDLYAETLLWLSERYTFAVPSSTVDQPDIPLHDHHRAVAAVACALHRWHEADGSLDDPKRIADGAIPKFRFLVGDLSGIQSGLFRLAAQRVRGANRILRARSFLLSMIVEAAALYCRRLLGLAPFSVLQAAGGRFLVLAAALDGIEERLEEARRDIDNWMLERYLGEVTLNVGLTEPLTGRDLGLGNFGRVLEAIRHAAACAKLEPGRRAYRAVLARDFPLGDACSACGIRPAAVRDGEVLRCTPCDEERRLGGDLPHAHIFRWTPRNSRGIALFGGLSLDWGFVRKKRSADLALRLPPLRRGSRSAAWRPHAGRALPRQLRSAVGWHHHGRL